LASVAVPVRPDPYGVAELGSKTSIVETDPDPRPLRGKKTQNIHFIYEE
jgi:hypothetical protein